MCQTRWLISASVAQSFFDGLSMDVSLVGLKLSPCFSSTFIAFYIEGGVKGDSIVGLIKALANFSLLWGWGIVRTAATSWLSFLWLFPPPAPVNYFENSVVGEKQIVGLKVRWYITVCFKLSRAFQFLHSCDTVKCLQMSSSGENISLQSFPLTRNSEDFWEY